MRDKMNPECISRTREESPLRIKVPELVVLGLLRNPDI